MALLSKRGWALFATCEGCLARTRAGARALLVNAGLDEEQRELRDEARALAAAELSPFSAEWDAAKHFPVATLKKLGGLGYGGCFVDEHFGGAGMSRADAAVLFESLAHGDVPLAAYVTIHNMVARVVNKHASEAAKAKYLPSIASMERLTSYCLTEPASGSDAASLATSAAADGDGYVLTGSKAFISGGGATDLYLVMARTTAGGRSAAGVTAFLVDADAPGVSFGKQEHKMGWRCQPTCSVSFDGVRVPAENRVGEEGEGFRIAMGALDGGRINIAACSLGGAQFCFDKTIEYIRERKQFGKRLDEFQNTQFRMADSATKLVASRLMVQQAARALDEENPSGPMLAAMAKRFATDSCYEVVDSCLQLHGGYGYISDYLIEQRLRDLRVHSILEGTNEIMRHVIWQGLRKEAAR